MHTNLNPRIEDTIALAMRTIKMAIIILITYFLTFAQVNSYTI